MLYLSFVVLSFSILTLTMLSQPSNALFPIDLTVLYPTDNTLAVVRLEHPLNAESPIVLQPLGEVMETRFSHPEKAFGGICVTSEPRLTLFNVLFKEFGIVLSPVNARLTAFFETYTVLVPPEAYFIFVVE